jgi:membrane-associated phospholipid phosphatase
MKNLKIIPFLLFFFVLFSFENEVHAQYAFPYSINWKKESIFLGSGMLIYGASYFIGQNLQALTQSEINALDKNKINAFDRSAIARWSTHAAHRSDVGLIAAPGLALSSAFIFPSINEAKNKPFNSMATLVLLCLESNLMNYAITEMTKYSVHRTRPYVYNPDVAWEEKMEKDARKSFFSGHTSITTTNAFFVAKVFSDYYPASRFKPLVWGLATGLSVWTGTERYLAGKHYPSDVISGFVVGAAVGYFVPHFHLSENNKVSLLPYKTNELTGIHVSYTF